MFPRVNSSPKTKKILNRALDGRRLTIEEGIRLMKAPPKDLMAIAMAADEVRRAKVGDEVSYVANRNINFTNICIGSCKFCAFRRKGGDDDAYFLDIPQVVKKTQEARQLGATEICLQGGLHPDLDVHFYADLLRSIKNKGNSLHLHAYSPMEIHHMARQSGMGVHDTLKYLKENGLDSIPGTAAEILDDEVRRRICPEKIKSDEWVAIVMEAHSLDIPATATMLYGHLEAPEQRVKHLAILRTMQDETNGFTEFIPLSFVHYKTALYKSGASGPGATGVDDSRTFAVSRLFLDNFRNIQASWVKLGRKFAQIMLNFGANDLGGTLMEESISRAAGLEAEMMTGEELERIILDAGKTPVQRDTLYRRVLSN
ncbi:MAG: 7,8-didemethyl-8-hydroxy-5-deazariboflavin synthase subunit CofH [Candidatus Hydrothermarchaeaceae archaeon]